MWCCWKNNTATNYRNYNHDVVRRKFLTTITRKFSRGAPSCTATAINIVASINASEEVSESASLSHSYVANGRRPLLMWSNRTTICIEDWAVRPLAACGKTGAARNHSYDVVGISGAVLFKCSFYSLPISFEGYVISVVGESLLVWRATSASAAEITSPSIRTAALTVTRDTLSQPAHSRSYSKSQHQWR